MRNLTETNLTDAVLAKLEGATDARFAQVMVPPSVAGRRGLGAGHSLS